MIEQKILPVISDWKSYEKFLKSNQTWCIFMDFHINFMQELMECLHRHKKKGIVHMDLIHGISNDAFGVQYMCQKLKVDGIISTRPKVIEEAKKNNTIAILRIFLLDSRSLKRSALMAEHLQPDYLEVLPGIIPGSVQMIREFSQIPVIGGGLIKSKEDIAAALNQGMAAITTSSLELCL